MTEPMVHVELVARVGAETFELGSGELTESTAHAEFAELLRRVADEIEQERRP